MRSYTIAVVVVAACTLLCASGSDAIVVADTAAAANATVCWKATVDRGVGTIPGSCTPGHVRSGALCYPTCEAGYTGVGPVCWQDCPKGWVDEGALCRKSGSITTIAKKSYGRGAGTVMSCGTDMQEDAGLCYKPCPSGYYGVGPVCWESCASPNAVSGGAICCASKSDCTSKIVGLCAGLPIAVMEALLSGGNATKIMQAAEQAIDAVLGFVMPLCSTL